MSFLLDGLHEDLNRSHRTPHPTAPPLRSQDTAAPLTDEQTARVAWKAHKRRNNSVIVDMFQGQFRSRTTCTSCGYVSSSFTPFANLSLPLPKRRGSLSLHDCLKLFVVSETISGWKCPKCQCARTARKCMDVWQLPPVLVVHLKRFSFDGPVRDKLRNLVRFPSDLDPHLICGKSQRYERYQL